MIRVLALIKVITRCTAIESDMFEVDPSYLSETGGRKQRKTRLRMVVPATFHGRHLCAKLMCSSRRGLHYQLILALAHVPWR